MEVITGFNEIIEFNIIQEFYDYEDFDEIEYISNRIILEKFDKFSKNLKRLTCKNNWLKTLDKLPKDLEILYCSYNQIKTLDNLPKDLKELRCNNNQIKTLDNLPKDLKELRCENNPIISINIPESIKYTNYKPITILKFFLTDKTTEKELLKHLNNIITEVKEDECRICREVKKVIRVCKFEDHCYCPNCFCKWFEDHERKCIFCSKKFEISSWLFHKI